MDTEAGANWPIDLPGLTMRAIAAVFLWVLLALQPSAVAGTAAPTFVEAHPALWRVHSSRGTVYLFGSVHLLPQNVNWHSADVNHAMHRASVFVFEIPIDDAAKDRVKSLIATRGTLPPGQSLRSLLPPQSQRDYDNAVAYLGIPGTALDTKRPWLASLTLDAIVLMKRSQLAAFGVDVIMTGEAKDAGKKLRYLETLDQQIALLVPQDPAVELEDFEVELREIETEEQELDKLTKAWETGDVATIAKLTDNAFEGRPQARAAFFDNRNHAWVKQIEAMLREHKIFFVTVGAGHLAGDAGVPALLRADGYKVDGP